MKVCFVASYLYPYLTGVFPDQRIGGAEFQQLQIIRALQQSSDMEISIVTLDFGQNDGESVGGVTVWKTYIEKGGIPLIRFFYPRLSDLWRALGRADADIYYLRVASYMLLPVGIYCRMRNKKMIFAAAHDTDFQKGSELLANSRDLWFFRAGLKLADLIVTQTGTQRNLLKKNYSLDGKVIRNFFLANDSSGKMISDVDITDVLWVATIRRFKRPELLLDIAERLPHRSFVMAGGPDEGDQEYYNAISRRAARLENVEFKGFVPPDQVDSLFRNAKVFVNTSVHEGFPNTFLQAWSKGVPVATFFDPDGAVQEHQLGATVVTVEEAVAAIDALVGSSGELCRRVQDYYNLNHGEQIVEDYLNVFNHLIGIDKAKST